jgi:hypothetical protein
MAQQGTSVTWTVAGSGDYELTLTSLANGDGRAGEGADLGATWADRARIELLLDFLAAPTAGEVVDVYWSSSVVGVASALDGECTGSDAAYNAEADMKRLHYVGSLVVSNDTDPQRASWIFFPPARYGLPVVSNQSGQALTATGADQVLKYTPLEA